MNKNSPNPKTFANKFFQWSKIWLGHWLWVGLVFFALCFLYTVPALQVGIKLLWWDLIQNVVKSSATCQSLKRNVKNLSCVSVIRGLNILNYMYTYGDDRRATPRHCLLSSQHNDGRFHISELYILEYGVKQQKKIIINTIKGYNLII